MKEIYWGTTYNTATGKYICTRVWISHFIGGSVESFAHIYLRNKDQRPFVHKFVYQYNEEDVCYYKSERILPITEKQYNEYINSEYIKIT